MKRELLELRHEDEGFKTLQDAIDFCNKRDGITYAEIGYRKNYHVFVGCFDHHFQFYHRVAIYEMIPKVTELEWGL